ncbi:hypothetical protein ABT314_05680, partial [Streptomyces spiralis]
RLPTQGSDSRRASAGGAGRVPPPLTGEVEQADLLLREDWDHPWILRVPRFLRRLLTEAPAVVTTPASDQTTWLEKHGVVTDEITP